MTDSENRPATLKLATADSPTIECSVQSLEGKRLALRTHQRLTVSTAVSIQCNDVMFLGDVMLCSPETGDEWHLEVKVHQMLTGLQNLMNLRARLFDEGAGQQASVAPALVPVRKSSYISRA